jgi:hypothetical protein
VTEASWSCRDDEECIRLIACAPRADVRVRPHVATVPGELTSMAGRVVEDGDDLCFVPRFAFVAGTTYDVEVDGEAVAQLDRPDVDRSSTTAVLDIRPSASVVPRNLLRFYVRFSAPMGEGGAVDHVRLVDEAGQTLAAVLLPTEYELWDAGRRRLTILLDPARIKRGLVAHREIGYPLRSGSSIRLVVDAELRDATGAPLVGPAERAYLVGDDQRDLVDPGQWVVSRPRLGSTEALALSFDRPLDHALLVRCLQVIGPDGRPLDGRAEIGEEERSWEWVPTVAWDPGSYAVVVDPVLEDVAGNSVSRVFDRDLERPDDDPRPDRPVRLSFTPG